MTKTPFFLRPPILLLIVVAFLFSCQLVDQALQSGTAVTDPTNSIRLISSQPRTLDPALTLGGPDGPLGHIFSGLVSLDINLQVQPELAAGWTVSDDGLLYTFICARTQYFITAVPSPHPMSFIPGTAPLTRPPPPIPF